MTCATSGYPDIDRFVNVPVLPQPPIPFDNRSEVFMPKLRYLAISSASWTRKAVSTLLASVMVPSIAKGLGLPYDPSS
jgi:hypothetical protein